MNFAAKPYGYKVGASVLPPTLYFVPPFSWNLPTVPRYKTSGSESLFALTLHMPYLGANFPRPPGGYYPRSVASAGRWLNFAGKALSVGRALGYAASSFWSSRPSANQAYKTSIRSSLYSRSKRSRGPRKFRRVVRRFHRVQLPRRSAYSKSKRFH